MREHHGKSRPLIPGPWISSDGAGPFEDASCVGLDVEAFFPEKARLSDNNLAALEVCSSCPVRVACLTYAVKNNLEGIWGGTTDANRNRVRKLPTTRAEWTDTDSVAFLEGVPAHRRIYNETELRALGRAIRKEVASGFSRAQTTQKLGIPDSVYRRAVAALDVYEKQRADRAAKRMDEHWAK